MIASYKCYICFLNCNFSYDTCFYRAWEPMLFLGFTLVLVDDSMTDSLCFPVKQALRSSRIISLTSITDLLLFMFDSEACCYLGLAP